MSALLVVSREKKETNAGGLKRPAGAEAVRHAVQLLARMQLRGVEADMASYSCFEALVLAASVHEMTEPHGGAGRTSESKEMAERQHASPGGQPREETHKGTCARPSDRAPPRGWSMASEPGGDGCGQARVAAA